MSEETGSTGDLGVGTSLKVLLVVALVVGFVLFLGWTTLVWALGLPGGVGVPLSLIVGSAVVAWNVAQTWRGYLVWALLCVTAVVWFVVWLVVR